MTKGRFIRCFDYVNHPYAQVRDALRAEAVSAFSQATRGAASRAHALASQLRVHIGHVDLAADIDISVTKIDETPGRGRSPATTHLFLEWQASESKRLFPLMHAELAVYALTGRETQLDFSGRYEPPLGLLGSAVDALVGHRIAEAAVHRFVSEVAAYLRTSLD